MYDDTVKRLRTATTLPVMNALCQEAADTIEELQAAEKKYLANISALETENQHLKREREWIPVTERLPEKEDMVIFHYAWTGMSGTVYKEVTLATFAELEHVGSKPLAWMPLPQPPKEE